MQRRPLSGQQRLIRGLLLALAVDLALIALLVPLLGGLIFGESHDWLLPGAVLGLAVAQAALLAALLTAAKRRD